MLVSYRYLVKPNQGLLDVGESKQISLIISPEKQTELVSGEAAEAQSLEVDKFQVGRLLSL